jgi:hypothetical protein
MKLTLRINDGRHGENSVLGVVDDRVDGRVSNERKEFGEMTIALQEGKWTFSKTELHSET